MALLVLAGFELVLNGICLQLLSRSVGRSPQLTASASDGGGESVGDRPTVAVVIPVYNEADNVRDCLRSVLASTLWTAEQMQVWLVDDQSTDATWAIAQAVQHEVNDPRLALLAGQPRPEGETWLGKNWACAQGADKATADYLLFMDADVRLQPGAIEAAIAQAKREQTDLLSCGPAIRCGCLAEWLVQPLMFSLIVLGFDFERVNDPQDERAFAAGPFMLFRRHAYDAIGGHRAVASQVVEDVELARLIKRSSLRLRFVSGSAFVTVRMYRNWAALWEGWTKNIYLGSQRNLIGTLSMALIMLLICTAPWVLLLVLMVKAGTIGVRAIDGLTLALTLLTIGLHYGLRRVGERDSKMPTRYWWLTGMGGVLVAAIAIGSIIKTETGWGWTWRGRVLKQPTGETTLAEP